MQRDSGIPAYKLVGLDSFLSDDDPAVFDFQFKVTLRLSQYDLEQRRAQAVLIGIAAVKEFNGERLEFGDENKIGDIPEAP